MASRTFATARIVVPQKLQTYDAQGGSNSGVVYSAPCTLLRIRALNVGSLLWLMFFDSATVPTNGTVPLLAPIPVAATTGVIDVDWNEDIGSAGLLGIQLSNGLVWAASTTSASLTVDGTSSLWPTCRYYA
jgi:hypothetical protein